MYFKCSLDTFMEKAKEVERIVCFGTGKKFTYFFNLFRTYDFMNKVTYAIDNNVDKQNTIIEVVGRKVKILSIEEAGSLELSNAIILITCEDYSEIVKQLNQHNTLSAVDYYCLVDMMNYSLEDEVMAKEIPEDIKLEKQPLIPKVIHYCWFGKNPIPDHYKAWMESWHKFCPDYEIIEWNEENYDITKNGYMLQAYERGKWGFVPDYARLDIIYNHGGIYLDTDVELLQNIDDLLYQQGFVGFERTEFVNFGSAFGAVKGLPIIKELRDYYENLSFINSDGSLNLLPSPSMQTKVLEEKGLVLNGEYQIVEDMTVFPEKMFNGMNERSRKIRLKPYTKSIHHYDASWKKTTTSQYFLQSGKSIMGDYGKELISVIVIAYNVEKYIEECVESIRKQSYSNLEIILVDDGSTDKTGDICDNYSSLDQRIKVVHKVNGGLVDARQEGMRNATGVYVAFVDGDDWIDEDMYEKLYLFAKLYSADVTISGIVREREQEKLYESNILDSGYYNKKDLEDKVFSRMLFSADRRSYYIDPSLCNKLFRIHCIKETLLNVEKDIFYLGEDAATLYPCLLKVESIFITRFCMYHHRIVSEENNTDYKTKQIFERLVSLFLYMKKTFNDLGYEETMLPQLYGYFTHMLSRMTYNAIDFDFYSYLKNGDKETENNRKNKIERKYILPLEDIAGCKNIVLYGAGKVGKAYYDQLKKNNYNVVLWADKEGDKLSKTTNLPIKTLDKIADLKYDIVIIATTKRDLVDSMWKDITQSGVSTYLIRWLSPIIE